MIPNTLPFMYHNSSKEFSCPFLKNFIEKKNQKKKHKKKKESKKKKSRIEKKHKNNAKNL